MEAFDTSGAVVTSHAGDPDAQETVFWTDLDPCTQGYVEALLRSVGAPFSDLAPETIAVILKDCGAWQAPLIGLGSHAYGGGNFWRDRQAGHYVAFPPLTIYLADDGKVRFRAGDPA